MINERAFVIESPVGSIKSDSGNHAIDVISVVGVEGVFDTTNNLRKEGNNGTIENLSVTPTGVSVIYSNKPTWTSTLDGGTF